MNGGGIGKRRSARLSHEGDGEDEPPAKRTKANGATTATVSTKQQDGDNNKAAAKRKARKGVLPESQRDTPRDANGS